MNARSGTNSLRHGCTRELSLPPVLCTEIAGRRPTARFPYNKYAAATVEAMRTRLFAGGGPLGAVVGLAVVIGTAAQARADVVFYENDTWKLSFDGRTGA